VSTVHISIGNSDGRLTTVEWADYYHDTDEFIRSQALQVYGAWHSLPAVPWLNACWAIQADEFDDLLRVGLAELARKYGQDSIAWLEGETEFITGTTR